MRYGIESILLRTAPIATTAMSSVRRGLRAGALSVPLLAVAALPSRMWGVLNGWGSSLDKVEKLLAGTLLDLSAVIVLLTPLVALLALLPPVFAKRLRNPNWQQLGSLIVTLPFGFLLYVLT